MTKFLLIGALSVFFITANLTAQKTTEVEVKKVCEGLDKSQKPVVAVLPFKISAEGAEHAVGTGLPDMLADAVFNSGCFRVVDRARLTDVLKEQGLGMEGSVDENSAPQVGKLVGAKVLVFGNVTIFKEGVSGGGAGLGSLFKTKKGLGGIIGSMKSTTSEIGFTLKFVDATTGEYLDSKSFTEKVTSTGLAGSGGGIGQHSATGVGGSFFQSKSMQDAVQKSLVKAVEYMSQNKEAYAGIADGNKTTDGSGSVANKSNCALLKVPAKPSIIVILPEEHIAGKGSNYDPYRGNSIYIHINSSQENEMPAYVSTIPCQAGETEISRKLTEFGLRLKDATQLEKLKNDQSFQNAFNSSADAAKLGSRFSADIMIVGDAFSEYSKSSNGMISCRATVSIKAFMTKDASIIATQSFKASGLDISEEIAGKTALQNAASKLGEYLLTQFCSKTDDIVSSMGGGAKPAASGALINETAIQFNNVDYNKATSIAKIIQSAGGVSKVERTSFENKTAKFKVSHSGDSNSLIDKIVNNKMGIKLDVLSATEDFANIDVK